MNTIESESLPERRRRYNEEFKAQAVSACQGIGVSVAAVALEHRLNANLLRRWIDRAEGRLPRRPLGRPPATPPALPAFVPVAWLANSSVCTSFETYVQNIDTLVSTNQRSKPRK